MSRSRPAAVRLRWFFLPGPCPRRFPVPSVKGCEWLCAWCSLGMVRFGAGTKVTALPVASSRCYDARFGFTRDFRLFSSSLIGGFLWQSRSASTVSDAGRNVLRTALNDPELEFVAVND